MPELKQIELWNDQYNRTDEDLPLMLPACFIDFGGIEWVTEGLHNQEGNCDIRFHLAMGFMLPNSNFGTGAWSANEYDAQVLDTMEKLHKALHGFQMKTENGVKSTELTRVRTEQDTQSNAVHVWILTYRTRIFDSSTDRDKHRAEYTIPNLSVRQL